MLHFVEKTTIKHSTLSLFGIFFSSSAVKGKLRVTSDFKELAKLTGNDMYSRTPHNLCLLEHLAPWYRQQQPYGTFSRPHPPTSLTSSHTFLCSHCGTTCLSRIGLISHQRACTRQGKPSLIFVREERP